MPGTPAATAGYFAIPLDHLEPDEVVVFDLYLPRKDGRVVLYREQNLVFTQENRERLIGSGVEELLVPDEQRGAYRVYRGARPGAPTPPQGSPVPDREMVPYVALRAPEPGAEERDLAEILADDSQPIATRGRVLLGVSQSVIEVAMADLGSPGLHQRVHRVAENTARFLLGEPQAYTTLVGALDLDFDVLTHSANTALYATQLAIALGMDDPADVAAIGRAALLHDIGKGDIPAELLHKDGELSDLEWAEVMSHVDRGVARLREAGWDDPLCVEVCQNHHERCDGSGYPRGLTAQQLSFASRLVAVADAFDAMTSTTNYRPALTGFQALWKMKRELTGQYDAHILDRFVELMLAPLTDTGRRRLGP